MLAEFSIYTLECNNYLHLCRNITVVIDVERDGEAIKDS